MSNSYGDLNDQERSVVASMRQGGRTSRSGITRRGTRPGYWQGRPELIGSNLGQDWRDVRSTEVNRGPAGSPFRPGSGLDQYTRAKGRAIRGSVNAYRQGRKEIIKDKTVGQAQESAEMYSDRWPDSGEPPYDQAAEAPPANPLFPNDSGEVGPEVAAWDAAFSGRQQRIKNVSGPGGAGGTRGTFG